MVTSQHSKMASSWTICSVALRARDGPERLDQAYRRLLTFEPSDTRPTGPDTSSSAPAPGCVLHPRK